MILPRALTAVEGTEGGGPIMERDESETMRTGRRRFLRSALLTGLAVAGGARRAAAAERPTVTVYKSPG
jgi:hypothetical protein